MSTPAFPCGEQELPQALGLSKQQYFAAVALQGLLASSNVSPPANETPEEITAWAKAITRLAKEFGQLMEAE